MKLDVITCQAYLRRYLIFSWFKRMKSSRQELENSIEQIKVMIEKYNLDANMFRKLFKGQQISGPLKFLGSFESYEVHWAKTYGYDKSNLPSLNKTKEDFEKL